MLYANHSPLEGESQKPSRQAKADAVGGTPGRQAVAGSHAGPCGTVLIYSNLSCDAACLLRAGKENSHDR